MAGPVGCGLCGIESIEQALLPARKVEAALTLSPHEIAEATASLAAHQPLFAATRAVHAAGFYRPGGGLLLSARTLAATMRWTSSAARWRGPALTVPAAQSS